MHAGLMQLNELPYLKCNTAKCNVKLFGFFFFSATFFFFFYKITATEPNLGNNQFRRTWKSSMHF